MEVLRQIYRIALAEVRRDADFPPRLLFGDLSAGVALGKVDCAFTKEQMRWEVLAVNENLASALGIAGLRHIGL